MTFDQWNKRETARLCKDEDREVARNIRRARAGGLARFMFWDDYLAAAKAEGFQPEEIR